GRLETACEIAGETGMPVMAHTHSLPPSRRDVLERLGKGDLLNNCFRHYPNAPTAPGGGVRDEVLKARERGVIFDIGHGGGSFGFGTTHQMMKAGFLPDVISSDVHCLSIDGPAYDLLVTMSKFLCLGMDLGAVIRSATMAPAAAIRRPDIATLKSGSPGDATVIAIEDGNFIYRDVLGEELPGKLRMASRGLVLGGKWHEGGGRK